MKIAVLWGGPGNEREVSRKTSQQVYQALQERHSPTLVELTPELTLTLGEKSIGWKDLKQFELVFIAMHGSYGEDGRVQAILESLSIPFNGPSARTSVITMDKILTQQIVAEQGIRVPQTLIITPETEMVDVTEIGFPCVVKPNQSGSSVGVSVVQEEDDLPKALEKAFAEDSLVLIQEYVPGKELTCAIMKNQDQDSVYALPPIEIITVDGWFDYENKYTSTETREICPAEISDELSQRIQDESSKIHDMLGCDGLTRSDFRYNPETDDLVFLEINTIPGQTEASLCPKAAAAIGKSFPEFIEDQVHLSLSK